MWGVWRNDLTPGDGSRYFQDSVLWSAHGKVDLAWSPLYDVFYGTTRKLVGGDAVTAENLHRALIALGVALLLLALARRLLPAGPALLVACWWAVLPINFDALYEVHLFAPAFPLAVALLLSDEPGPWRRGWAFALIVLATLLVRNEFGFVAVLLGAGLILVTRGRRGPVAALAVPLAAVLLFSLAMYSRGVEKDGALRDSLEGRQQTALCQHFALNYEQRHSEVRLNPFLQCRALMQQTFGQEHPTFLAAWSDNPKAMAAFTAWHGRLVPNGLQLGLFYGVADHTTPDFAPINLGRPYAGVLGLVLLTLLVLGGRALWLDRAGWLPELRRQRLAWLAVGAGAAGSLIVGTFFVRPRPSFIFGLTIGVMLAAGLALAALLRRHRVERAGDLAALLIPLLLLVFLPVHFKSQATPLADAYHRLRPVSDRIEAGRPVALARLAFGDDVCFYVAPNRPCRVVDYQGAIAPQLGRVGLARALDRAGAGVFYANPSLAASKPVASFIRRPGGGWTVARSGVDERGRWAVLVRG
jgi:hypothetical protein